MADIKQLTVNEVTYDLKDQNARTRIEAIEDLTNTSFLNALLDVIHPVGCVRLTMTNTAPSTRGIWQRIASGEALVGVDAESDITALQTAGNSFGQPDAIIPEHIHELSRPSPLYTSPIQDHTHQVRYASFKEAGNTTEHHSIIDFNSGSYSVNTGPAGGHGHTMNHTHAVQTPEDSEDVTNKNYQPSFSVYVWQRVS